MVFQNYINIVDTVTIHDNSFARSHIVAEKNGLNLSWEIHQPDVWSHIQELSHVKIT